MAATTSPESGTLHETDRITVGRNVADGGCVPDDVLVRETERVGGGVVVEASRDDVNDEVDNSDGFVDSLSSVPEQQLGVCSALIAFPSSCTSLDAPRERPRAGCCGTS